MTRCQLRDRLWRRDVGSGALVALAWLVHGMAPDTTGSAWLTGGTALVLGFAAPAWGLVLLAVIAPFEWAREVTGAGTVHTAELVLAALLPGALWNLRRHPGWWRPVAPVWRWGLPLVLILAASAWVSGEAAAWKGALKWLEFGAALLLSVHVLRRADEVGRIVGWTVAAATVSAVWGLAQTAAGPAFGTSDIYFGSLQVARAGAGFGPNTLALYVALVLPAAWAASLRHPQAGMRRAAALAAAVLLAGWLAAFSMTGAVALLAAAAASGMLWLGRTGRRASWIAGLGTAALAGAALWLAGPSLWETVLNKWHSFQDRLAYAGVVGSLLRDHPWLGVGPGLYRMIAPTYAGGGVNVVGVITHPHSLWLTLLAETGLLGLCAAAWAATRALRAAAGPAQRLPAGWPRPAIRALIAGLIGVGVANLVEHGLVHDRGVHVALIVGAALVWARRPVRRRFPEPRARAERLWAEVAPAAPREHEERRNARAPYYACLAQAAADAGPAPVMIELGCGPALDALHLAARVPGEIHGVDWSERALALARAAAVRLPGRVQLHCADLRRTGLPAGCADVVFSQGVWEHFPDPGPVWAEARRLLKPGGSLVIDVPQALHTYTLVKWARRLLGTWPWGWETQYTLGALRRDARRHGFTLQAARGYGYWGGIDPSRWLRDLLTPLVPRAWSQWETRTGVWWMMNLSVRLQRSGVRGG